jgi:hypothetical protein
MYHDNLLRDVTVAIHESCETRALCRKQRFSRFCKQAYNVPRWHGRRGSSYRSSAFPKTASEDRHWWEFASGLSEMECCDKSLVLGWWPQMTDVADDLIVVKGIHQCCMTGSTQFWLGRKVFLHMIWQLDNGVSLWRHLWQQQQGKVGDLIICSRFTVARRPVGDVRCRTEEFSNWLRV